MLCRYDESMSDEHHHAYEESEDDFVDQVLPTGQQAYGDENVVSLDADDD